MHWRMYDTIDYPRCERHISQSNLSMNAPKPFKREREEMSGTGKETLKGAGTHVTQMSISQSTPMDRDQLF